ncbi:MAG: cupin domain-containing protein [Oscillospiraceae bacterium]|nr:cupin domain-containing protein [Oscillospiraceae bacterium]
MGQIIDGSIAYIKLKGGGPTEQHTHGHSHLFIVVKGEAKVLLDQEEAIIRKDEAFLVNGTVPHSVWSNQDEETVMIGISVR